MGSSAKWTPTPPVGNPLTVRNRHPLPKPRETGAAPNRRTNGHPLSNRHRTHDKQHSREDRPGPQHTNPGQEPSPNHPPFRHSENEIHNLQPYSFPTATVACLLRGILRLTSLSLPLRHKRSSNTDTIPNSIRFVKIFLFPLILT